jgi:ABC-type lipoprotein export system ATPase subunit
LYTTSAGPEIGALARAIIAKPTLLLADEPTGNLHSDQGRQIMELFKKLNSEGTTIIQVTHSEKNAAHGKRIIQMKDGEIVNELLTERGRTRAHLATV